MAGLTTGNRGRTLRHAGIFVLLALVAGGGGVAAGFSGPKAYRTGAGPAGANFEPSLASSLQASIDSLLLLRGFKGISASVRVPGQGTWTGVSGVSHAGVNITPGTRFGIASQTKTFMAVLLLRLQELGVLSLDDSLHTWLPAIPNVDSTITIRQLLSHRSGVFNIVEYPHFSDSISADYTRHWTPGEIVSRFIGAPYCAPGACYHYSNTNYILAGMIVEAATGSPVAAKLRELVVGPAGLDETFFDVEEAVPDTVAHPWNFGVDGTGHSYVAINSAIWCAGAMYSTTRDMIRFYDLLFGGEIIGPASLDEMTAFTATGVIPEYSGLGMMKGVLAGRTELGHDGNWGGYLSVTTVDSIAGFGISVAINSRPSDALEVLMDLITRVAGYPFAVATIPVAEAWNLVSVPFSRGDMGVADIFPTSSSPAYAYQGTYQPVDLLANGVGYWLKFPAAESLLCSGSERPGDTVDVNPGWNIIGSISQPVAVGDIGSIPGGLVISPVFGYEGSYVIADSIRPGRAYWVKADAGGQLTMFAPAAASAASRVRILPTSEVPPPPPGGVTGPATGPSGLPGALALGQNYPNPFNPTTTIRFTIGRPAFVTLKVYDMLGRVVADLAAEDLPPGDYERTLNASGLAGGVYYSCLRAGDQSAVRAIVLQK